MTQADLAYVLGVSQQAVNQMAVGKRGFSAEMAKALGEAFGVSPEYLLGLQKAVEVKAQLSRSEDPSPAVRRRSQLLSAFPVREMIKRGWVKEDTETLESEVLDFFQTNDVNAVPHLVHAARKTLPDADVSPAQLAWLYRVRMMADAQLVAEYNDLSAPRAIQKLSALLLSAEEARKVPRILAESGIRFVLVEGLPSAKIDGVCLWLNERSPVIGLSMRLDRIDNFWFVLRHELEHVRLRHGMDGAMVDVDTGGAPGASVPEEERLANAAAAEFCVPQKKVASFVLRKSPLISERDVLAFAKVNNVHPGIAVGQIQRHINRYDWLRQHQVKIRNIVAPNAMVDGWGDVAKLGI